MLITKDLVLDKAKFSDWKDLYENIWSQPESARYMAWRVARSEQDARIRIQKTIEFQKSHDAYIIYEKEGAKAVGFAGVEQVMPDTFQETGICLGPRYTRRGFGKQVMERLLFYCRQKWGARTFLYSTREENEAAKGLASALGFTEISSEVKTGSRGGESYRLLWYSLDLSKLEGK